MIKISVIVPIHRIDRIDEILLSYVNQDADPNSYEVVVIATNPRTMNVVTSKVMDIENKHAQHFNCIQLPGSSNCRSRNAGVESAQNEIMLFVDGDQVICSHLVRVHRRNLQRGEIGVGITNIDVRVDTKHMLSVRIPAFRGHTGSIAWLPIGNVSVSQFTEMLNLTQATGFANFTNRNFLRDYVNVVTRNCSIYRSDFYDIGGFDIDLEYSETSPSRGWEDTDYGIRAYEKGMKFRLIPGWTVHPIHPIVVKDDGLANVIKLLKKHPWFLKERPEWFVGKYDISMIRRLLV